MKACSLRDMISPGVRRRKKITLHIGIISHRMNTDRKWTLPGMPKWPGSGLLLAGRSLSSRNSRDGSPVTNSKRPGSAHKRRADLRLTFLIRTTNHKGHEGHKGEPGD